MSSPDLARRPQPDPDDNLSEKRQRVGPSISLLRYTVASPSNRPNFLTGNSGTLGSPSSAHHGQQVNTISPMPTGGPEGSRGGLSPHAWAALLDTVLAGLDSVGPEQQAPLQAPQQAPRQAPQQQIHDSPETSGAAVVDCSPSRLPWCEDPDLLTMVFEGFPDSPSCGASSQKGEDSVRLARVLSAFVDFLALQQVGFVKTSTCQSRGFVLMI